MKAMGSRVCRHGNQAGFSLVELLLAAFVMAIGILGLTMLQVMSIRSATGGKALNTAVMVGEGVLESIQSEGRQRMLFMKYGGTAPATTFFGTATVHQFYAFDGSVLPDAANSFFAVDITPADVVALSAAGGTKRFTVTITFKDTPNPSNPSVTIQRTVTLTRQVAYA